MQPKKIVVIGPESTGKSTLCAALARHYDTLWVREYAREYLEKNGKEYVLADLDKIAVGQLKTEDEAEKELQNNSIVKPLIIDTDMNVMRVWYEYVFNTCPLKVLDTIATRNYDLYLLTNIDLPWVKDELREYPDLETRRKLFHYYREILISQPKPWALVSGVGDDRTKMAIAKIDEILSA